MNHPSTNSAPPRSVTFDRVMASGTAMAALSGVGILANAPEASAAIVYSGVVSLNVPGSTDGLYLNVVTGISATSSGLVAGWDINPYSVLGFGWFNASPDTSHGALNLGGTVFNPVGTSVDISGTYASFGFAVGAAQATLNSSDNYIGFRFLNEGTSLIHYGWAQFEFGASVFDRSIIGYAYEDVAGAGILIGATGVSAIPEPSSSMGVLALGAAGLLIRRRKAA